MVYSLCLQGPYPWVCQSTPIPQLSCVMDLSLSCILLSREFHRWLYMFFFPGETISSLQEQCQGNCRHNSLLYRISKIHLRKLGGKNKCHPTVPLQCWKLFFISKLFSVGTHQTNVGGLSPSESVQSSVTAPVVLVSLEKQCSQYSCIVPMFVQRLFMLGFFIKDFSIPYPERELSFFLF